MAQFTFGPVELYLVGMPDERPSDGVLEALRELLDAGMVRLLDFVIISKDADGSLTVTEIEDEVDHYGFGGVELGAIGIAGDEDIAEFAELVAPGSAAAIVAIELLWAKRLAERVAGSGAEVLSMERIPAPVVNGLVDGVNDDATNMLNEN